MKLQSLKQLVIAWPIAHAFIQVRQWWRLCRTAVFQTEQLEWRVQEQIARVLLPSLHRDGYVFLDVGAHIGSITSQMLHRHPHAKIVAVEAIPEKAAALQRRFSRITVHACAVGDRHGEVEFVTDADLPGCGSVMNGDAPSNRKRHQVINVPMRRIDDLVDEQLKVDLIKIDVEGAEQSALNGANRLLDRCRPAILFESGPPDDAAQLASIVSLFDWLVARNYEVLIPSRLAHNAPPLTRDGFIEAHYFPFRTMDYFAVPTERRREFRDLARQALGVQAVD